MYKKIKIITSPWSLAAIPLAVLAFILLQGWHTKTSADTLQHQNFPDKRVWAHIIPHGLPNFTEIGGGTEWGDLYSLNLVQGGYSSTPRPSDGVPRALQAGVTGVQILHFDFNHGSDFVFPWFAQADATWKDTDPKNDFMVAPCLEVSTPENASRIIKEYAEAAQGHPSAARIDGKLVIYTYGSFNMSPQQWSAARGQLGDLNNSVYIIGDLGTRASQYNYTVNMAAIAPYFPVFDASYAFEDSLDRIWSSLITLLNNNNRQYAGGVQPGYDRETCDIYCGYIDAAGTARYRDLWEKHLAAGTQWVNMITWNDMVERTEVQATSNWNSTRSDITAFYSAKLRGIAFPRPLAELYITTPQYVKAGQAIQAEGLVLNGGLTPVKVVTDILDSSGNVVSEKATKDVAAGIADAATTPSTATVGDASAGSYFRARATMYDGASGTMLKQVVSAPVVVYAADAQPASRLHRLYYSVPAYAALASKPTLQLSGSPMEQGGATATVQAPAGSNVRFIEVIQNTRQVQNGFAQSSFSAHVPMGNRTIIGGQVTSATPNGFYIGRVIDENERVGYTDPIFISASGQIIVPTPTPSPAPAPTPEPAPTPTPSPTPAPTPPPSTPPGNGMQLTATLLSSHYVKMSLTGTAAWALVDVSIRTPDGVTNSARYQADGSGNLTLYQTFSWGLNGNVVFTTVTNGVTSTSTVTI